jgi:hypothetical protein
MEPWECMKEFYMHQFAAQAESGEEISEEYEADDAEYASEVSSWENDDVSWNEMSEDEILNA